MGYDNLHSEFRELGDTIMGALQSAFVGSEILPVEDGFCYRKLILVGGQTICFQKWRKGNSPFYLIARDVKPNDYERNPGVLQLDLSLIRHRKDGVYQWCLHPPTNPEMEALYNELVGEPTAIPKNYANAVKEQRNILQPGSRLFSKVHKFAKNVSLDELCAKVIELFTEVFRVNGIQVSTRKKLNEPKNSSGKRVTREADERNEQAPFRAMLLEAYSSQCAIAGEGPSGALQACHVKGHSESKNNQLENGILLRADLHLLLDGGILKINPKTYKVEVDPALKGTSYWAFNKKKIRKTVDGTYPSQEFLKIKYEE